MDKSIGCGIAIIGASILACYLFFKYIAVICVALIIFGLLWAGISSLMKNKS